MFKIHANYWTFFGFWMGGRTAALCMECDSALVSGVVFVSHPGPTISLTIKADRLSAIMVLQIHIKLLCIHNIM